MGGLIQQKQNTVELIDIGNRFKTIVSDCGLAAGIEFSIVAIDFDKKIIHIRSAQLPSTDYRLLYASLERALGEGSIIPLLVQHRGVDPMMSTYDHSLPTGYCLHEWATYNSGWSEYEYCSKCGVRKDGSQ